MRPSPKKLLHGLLYTAPVLLLTLAACGGGGGGGGGTGVTLAAAYTVGGAASGVLGTPPASGLVLRNNGGDDLKVASGVASYKFSTAVIAGKPYNVTVLKNPSSPVQKCTVINGSGTMPAYNVTNANVSCVTAYTVGGTSITGLTGTGLVLQNNLADNLLISSTATTFNFDIPVEDQGAYSVKVLTQPRTPAQTCTIGNASGNINNAPMTNVSIICTTDTTLPLTDPYVYVANLGSIGANGVSVFTSASGVLTTGAAKPTGSGPAAIEVDPAGKFAYVANSNDDTISGFSIASGVLTAMPDVDGGTVGPQTTIATGNEPRAIAIHPSGKFAYVTNFLANSVSVYSIAANGQLASIDANGATVGTQASIVTRSNPIAIAIDPSGGHAYVANAGSNDVSVYSIDPTSGALTAIPASTVSGGSATYIASGGTTPSSIKVGPNDAYLYVTNRSGIISIFPITSGQLGDVSAHDVTSDSGASTPVSIAIDPAAKYVYVVNQGSGNINVYETSGSGALNYKTLQYSTGSLPISIRLDSTGQYAYVTNSGSNDISVFRVNSTTGALTHIDNANPGINFLAGATPSAVATSR